MHRRLDSEVAPERSGPARGPAPGAASAAAKTLRLGGRPSLAGALALQRAAGNRVLARQIPKIALDAIEKAQNKPVPDLSPRRIADRNLSHDGRAVPGRNGATARSRVGHPGRRPPPAG